uniref:protein SPT2 homolog n=1 Tax=Styela clava TaxID=7725 RepID=UPI001939371E|nr:protein SPT2 homolog [Styela clava]
MDINDILNQARKNTKEQNVSFKYSTDVRPAKKLPRSNVNPEAIKAFLDKKKKNEVHNLVEAQKKKEGLQKLRDESKTTRKANSMAKRTKDNLKVYKGEDVLGIYAEPKKRRRRGGHSPLRLSPEADRKHGAFMKSISKIKVPGINDDESDEDEYKEPVLEQDERKIRKLEKKKAKARSASNLEFGDLLQLAEKHKNKVDCPSSDSENSDSDSGEDSDGSTDKYGRPLTAEEKYQRERMKRRELEERLKCASAPKATPTNMNSHKSKPSSGFLPNFKIGKLSSGMSEESKRAKVKLLMDKLKKTSAEKGNDDQSENKGSSKQRKAHSDKKMHKSHSTPSLTQLDKQKDKRVKEGMRKPKPSGINNTKTKESSTRSKDEKLKGLPDSRLMLSKASSSKNLHMIRKEKHVRPSSDSEAKQTHIENHFKPRKKQLQGSSNLKSSTHKRIEEKSITNPYKHTVVKPSTATKRTADTLVDPWSKSNKGAGACSNTVKKMKMKSSEQHIPAKKACTLSVTSESVRTNYPGVAQADPYIQAYRKNGKVIPKLTPEMVARCKAAIARKLQQDGKVPHGRGHHPLPTKQRYGVIADDDSDEYDSELDDFIVDEEDEQVVDDDEVDVSSHIKAIFGYDKLKYGRESEWELSRMDASYKDIEKEEKRSLRIAREEDAREAKLEEERMKKLLKKNKR